MIEVEIGDWVDAPRALPEGEVIFAIGDVHGHAPQLEKLHDFLAARIGAVREPARTTLVWLGDYIDRGPEPRRCLALVRAGLGIEGLAEVRLKGNHEAFMSEVVEQLSPRLDSIHAWIANGGSHTIKGLLGQDDWRSPEDLAAALRASLGPEELEFLATLRLSYRQGPYVFAHAGINPARALDDQREHDLIWIREPFLSAYGWPHGFTVVHGHTPERPCVLPHRIGIDSGVYFTGRLTLVELAGHRLRFVTAYDPSVALETQLL